MNKGMLLCHTWTRGDKNMEESKYKRSFGLHRKVNIITQEQTVVPSIKELYNKGDHC